MKKQILTLAIAAIFIWGCNSETKKESLTSSSAVSDGIDTDAVDNVPDADMHTAEISLDWYGIYRGTVPCKDCDGILTEITLNKDKTYEFKSFRIHTNPVDTTRITQKGSFVWDKKGSIIVLGKVAPDRPDHFFVGENTLTQLDRDGNRITGDLADKYILKKVGSQIIE